MPGLSPATVLALTRTDDTDLRAAVEAAAARRLDGAVPGAGPTVRRSG
ncbi:hypothetical protein [Modestobacter sp. SSW1-42]